MPRTNNKDHQSINKITIPANGKLLFSAEYFVLDGALALALPTSRGQIFTFEIVPDSNFIFWKSYDEKNQLWFDAVFSMEKLEATQTNNIEISNRLTQILRAVRELNISFFEKNKGAKVESRLTFPRNWGLGTSSTLIYAIAKWANVNPFILLEKTFGGSGYDIACAGTERSIFYQIKNKKPTWEECDFLPPFADQLYFIFLGKKQNSRDGIRHYRKIKKQPFLLEKISKLSQQMLASTSLSDFEKIINAHENLISKTLHLQKVKDLHFKDYWGSVKSLGAWGGDFVLATSDRTEAETKLYFNKKGFEVFLKYKDLI